MYCSKLCHFTALSILLVFQNYKSPDSNKSDFATPIFGIWQTHNRDIEASLHIFLDSTFYVDVHKDEEIEVSGIATFISGQNVVFKNTKGTDPASSNPDPGKYTYTISGDTAHFTIIDDTLSRRSGLLAGPWTKSTE